MNRTAARSLLLLTVLLLSAAGCGRDFRSFYPRWNASRVERLKLFENVETLAVAPVAPGPGVDEKELGYVPLFQRALRNRLMGLKRFRLVSEDEFGRALRKAAGVNKPGRPLPSPLDEKVLLEAAANSGADAVLTVVMEDFDPYLSPKVVLLARLYLARRASPSERDIVAMTDDGVPSGVPFAARRRFVWQQDFVLDANDAGTLELVGAFARTQELKYDGLGPKIFIRSMERFLDFAAAVLARRLFRDAEFYKAVRDYEKRRRKRRPAPAGDVPFELR